MSVFVLVHGSWNGSWSWKKVTPLLLQAGHTVYAPTLTGMGDRKHLHARGITLDTHIQDIAQLLEYEDLSDVMLVGHSYGGMVISGVAEQAAERIARLIYLDAFIPQDGENAYQLMPDRGAYLSQRVKTEGDGWFVPSLTPYGLGVTDPVDIQWVNARLTPTTAATFEQPIHLGNAAARQIPRSYIQTSEYERMAIRAKSAGWDFHELQVGHSAMITAPRELATILMTCAKA
jgi:pimeloyl-ACP methyl ester carboxylesterase